MCCCCCCCCFCFLLLCESKNYLQHLATARETSFVKIIGHCFIALFAFRFISFRLDIACCFSSVFCSLCRFSTSPCPSSLSHFLFPHLNYNQKLAIQLATESTDCTKTQTPQTPFKPTLDSPQIHFKFNSDLLSGIKVLWNERTLWKLLDANLLKYRKQLRKLHSRTSV